MTQKCYLFLWRHHISHLFQSFGGQKLRYEFAIWHANYSVSYTYNSFLKNLKILDFRALFPEKLVFFILGVNFFFFENPRYPSCRKFNFLCFDIFCLRFASSIHWSTIHIADDHFSSKSHAMTSLKRHFLKKNQPNLIKVSDNVSNWCPIGYWKFGGDIVRSSQVIANIREGGRICPPAGRGLRMN